MNILSGYQTRFLSLRHNQIIMFVLLSLNHGISNMILLFLMYEKQSEAPQQEKETLLGVDDQGNSSGGGVTDDTVKAPTEDLMTNADTGHSEIPVLNSQIDVSAQFDGMLEDPERTARTENVVFEERWQKFVQQLEEEEKEESKETNKNLGRPDTSVEGGNVDEISGRKLEAKTSSNERQTVKGNSEGGTATTLNAQGNMNNTQETCKENKDKIKSEESDATRSTSENLKKNDKVCFSNLNGSNLSVLISEPPPFFSRSGRIA